MKTPKPKVLEFMMRQLHKYRDFEAFNIEKWVFVKSGKYLGNGNYDYGEEINEVVSLGDKWVASYDCSNIYRTRVEIPESYKDSRVYLEIDFGGEALVKINGEIAGSLSSTMNRGWTSRDTIIVDRKFLDCGVLDIELELAIDSGGFCDFAMDGAKTLTYTFEKARLCRVDSECEGYIFDIYLLLDAYKAVEDEYLKESLYKLLDDSIHMVDFDFEESHVRQSIYEARKHLNAGLAKIQFTPQSEVIMQGHSHIDIAWLWRIQETERKAARTFANNLSIMDKYEDFKFAQSQAIVYDMTKRLCPEIYEKIKTKVKNGQWEIVGNVWVEADTNVASGESLIRQLLYGREYFKKEFGVVSDTYWLPDCFGFSWALPQIIRRSGMKYFITAKLCGQDTNRFPYTSFVWKGHDGSEIVGYLARTHYQGEFTPYELMKAQKENDQKDVFRKAFGMYGYGDGGGGSTYTMLERAKRLKDYPGLPKAKTGTSEEFFNELGKVKTELPVINDELYYENHRGTYTSQGFIKKGNRKGEILLTEAESASLIASAVTGFEYDKDRIEDTWKILLTNQFHDILPGTSIHEAMEDCRPAYEKIMKDGTEIKLAALNAVSREIASPDDGVAVWNLSHNTVSSEVIIDTNGRYLAEVDGTEPVQVLTSDGKLKLLAENIPPMGYKVYLYKSELSAVKGVVTVTKNLLENDYLRVELNDNGIITSIYDKANKRETLKGAGNLLSVHQDKCVHETAWNLELNYKKKRWDLTSAESIEIKEQSEVCGIITVKRRFNRSEIVQDIILRANENHLEFDTYVNWQERDKILKAGFDVDILNTFASFEIAHGAIKRPNHSNNSYDKARFEQCGHKWADLSEGDYGVSLLTDCKYGYDVFGSVMRISLLRAPNCPDRTADTGEHTFKYAYYPHRHSWQQGGTVEKALTFNKELCPIAVGKNNGALPSYRSFVELGGKTVVLDALKKAQDGNGFILRVYEPEQGRGTVTVKMSLPFTKVTECNLMEEDEAPVKTENGSFSFDIKPFEVRTFRLS